MARASTITAATSTTTSSHPGSGVGLHRRLSPRRLERPIPFWLAWPLAILLWVATEVGSDLTIGWLWDRTSWSHLKLAIVYFVVGGSLGILSALAWPERLIGTGPLTGLSLVLVPLSTAAVMSWIGARTGGQGRRSGGLFQFWFAFDFGFAAALARFAMLKGWL